MLRGHFLDWPLKRHFYYPILLTATFVVLRFLNTPLDECALLVAVSRKCPKAHRRAKRSFPSTAACTLTSTLGNFLPFVPLPCHGSAQGKSSRQVCQVLLPSFVKPKSYSSKHRRLTKVLIARRRARSFGYCCRVFLSQTPRLGFASDGTSSRWSSQILAEIRQGPSAAHVICWGFCKSSRFKTNQRTSALLQGTVDCYNSAFYSLGRQLYHKQCMFRSWISRKSKKSFSWMTIASCSHLTVENPYSTWM